MIKRRLPRDNLFERRDICAVGVLLSTNKKNKGLRENE